MLAATPNDLELELKPNYERFVVEMKTPDAGVFRKLRTCGVFQNAAVVSDLGGGG
jgi:hypothetical protein